jgi:ATP-dependent DNA helicase RecQ
LYAQQQLQLLPKEKSSVLSLNQINTLEIEVSPDGENLTYVKQYVNNNIPLGDVFGKIIEQVKTDKQGTSRTIIYCQIIKQCAILWRIFKLELAYDIYLNGSGLVKDFLVQMFHSGTPKSTKELILDNTAKANGHIRIIICTIAFVGMGIDCKGVRRVIHFGPSSNIESYVQQCGRPG